MQVSSRTSSTSCCSRSRCVSVHAMLDKKPERAVEPAKKLFDGAPATTTTTSQVRPQAPVAALQPLPKGVLPTIEYQRQRAKEMLKYFKAQKLNETIVKSQVFGWTPPNEISNGRWTMFGLLVGMLTEYATGVDFPNQLKLMFTYLGIADFE